MSISLLKNVRKLMDKLSISGVGIHRIFIDCLLTLRISNLIKKKFNSTDSIIVNTINN